MALGGMWSHYGSGFDLIGDDDSSDHFFYKTSRMHHLQFYMSYALFKNKGMINFKLGYRHPLTNYSYTFSGPSSPTPKEIQRIRRGLSSGWMANISIGIFPLKND